MPAVNLTKRLVKGTPLTNIEVDANWDTLLSFMNGVLLPTTAHDLNDYDTPGVYGQNATAGAVAGSNYPVDPTGTPVAGILKVWKGATGGNIVAHQEYRTYYLNGSTIFYRNKVGVDWGDWIRIPKYTEAMTHVYLSAATDCNTLNADNTFYTFSSGTIMTSGTNWPPAGTNITGGEVEVVWLSTTKAWQMVTLPVAGQKPRIYARYGNPTTQVWEAWKIISSVSDPVWLPTADAGDVYVDGSGWYRWGGSSYVWEGYATLLPTTAHDLNTYTTTGQYRQTTNAGAIAGGSSYPSPFAGYLEVISGGAANTSCKQEYTISSASNVSLTAGPRKFWRMQTGASTWSPWQEVLTTALGMTHQFLTAATDANTLNADNTFYTWTSGTLMSTGSNFPAGVSAAGYMKVFWHAATIVSQELTVLVTGQKPRTFFRFGNSSTNSWQPWKSTGSQSTATFPTTDCGDIYVDGKGWYAWDGSAYKLTRAGMDHGQCRFVFVSTTECRLMPHNGNGLIINGRQFRIPEAGVPITNAGTAGNGRYFVFAKDDGVGGMALELASTSGASGSVHTDGVVIKTGDPARTLVGWLGTTGGNTFQDSVGGRLVASWFNRRRRSVVEQLAGSLGSSTLVGLGNGRTLFNWAGEEVSVMISGYCVTTGPGVYYEVQARRGGATPPFVPGVAAGRSDPGPAAVSSTVSDLVSEGAAIYQLWGLVNAYTVNLGLMFECSTNM